MLFRRAPAGHVRVTDEDLRALRTFERTWGVLDDSIGGIDRRALDAMKRLGKLADRIEAAVEQEPALAGQAEPLLR